MHRMIIAAAVSALFAAGAAHAGNWNDDSSWSWSSASPAPCGCQGYQDYRGYDDRSDYGYGQSYDDQDYGYSDEGYGYDGGDYGYAAPYYGDRAYDYDRDDSRSYYVTPRYRSYTHGYGYDDRYRAPRARSYRSYRYTPQHDRYGPTRRYYGTHSSRDGERG
ncbi:MAG TPA: hypothetical protein VIJ94_01360 [Caulobacteraceae bacterium]